MKTLSQLKGRTCLATADELKEATKLQKWDLLSQKKAYLTCHEDGLKKLRILVGLQDAEGEVVKERMILFEGHRTRWSKTQIHRFQGPYATEN